MDKTNFTQSVINLKLQSQRYFILICGLILIVLAQGVIIFYQNRNEKVIIVPPNLSTGFWVGRAAVDNDYLTEMARHYATELLNVTPHSIDYKIKQLLRISNPSDYGAIRAQFDEIAKKVKRDQIVTTFLPHHVTINSETLSANVAGELMVILGQHPIASNQVTYQIKFHYLNGRLLLSEFSEIKEKKDA